MCGYYCWFEVCYFNDTVIQDILEQPKAFKSLEGADSKKKKKKPPLQHHRCGQSAELFAGSFVSVNPARTYPRVLPASLPSVSEPDRNQGGSLVLPGLELLPVPEPLLNFELETKDGRSVINLTVVPTQDQKWNQIKNHSSLLPGWTETTFSPQALR